MAYDPDSPLVLQQPGVNGVRYASRIYYLYYTSTAQKLFMRVPIDPGTHDPAGDPSRGGLGPWRGPGRSPGRIEPALSSRTTCEVI